MEKQQEGETALKPVPSTNFNYAIDVAPLLAVTPKSLRFWIGFEWQPSIGRWMAHCGISNGFRLITPAVLKSLIRQARELQLLVTSYRAHHQPSEP
jgi:hypothetical protein